MQSKPPTSRRAAEYGEASIRVLKGLEPVRQRPGMYTRTDSPLHIVQEVIDNASDEILAGFGRHIDVTLHADGSVSVEDDGRGIPVGLHPEEKAPVVEIVFTRLHAGGKFDKRAGGAYSFAGGLHGVGVSVTNALSSKLDVTVWRDGKVHTIVFADGEVSERLRSQSAKSAPKASGTRVRTWPNPKYFDTPQIPADELERLLRSKAVLLPGTEVSLTIEKTGATQRWHYGGGLLEYLLASLAADPYLPPFESSGFAAADDASYAEGEGAGWVVVWTEDGPVTRESYVNLIPTPAGGTHEAGLRDGLFNAVRAFVDAHGLLPKGVKLLPEDVFARASFVLSAKVLDPQFQGQIKERLNSRDALRLVSSFVRPQLEFWLNQHPNEGRQLAELVIRQAQARARAGQKVEKKKGSAVAVLPGKLTDCESTELERNELFLVEGDSAGGSAKMGRDKGFQAILPLRGKVLNTWEVERDRLFGNAEVHDIAVAIGVDPHGPADAVNHRGPALRQDLHSGGCRRRRLTHPGPAADTVLPSLPAAGRPRSHLRRAPATVPGGRRRPGQAPCAPAVLPGRSRTRRHAGETGRRGCEGERLGHGALQGLGRDEPRAAVGNDDESGHAPFAPRWPGRPPG